MDGFAALLPGRLRVRPAHGSLLLVRGFWSDQGPEAPALIGEGGTVPIGAEPEGALRCPWAKRKQVRGQRSVGGCKGLQVGASGGEVCRGKCLVKGNDVWGLWVEDGL